MKINSISNQYSYSHQYRTNRQNNNDKVNFKAYLKRESNVQALAKLTLEELQILSKYIEKLKDAKFVDFKIIQHPDLDITSWTNPVIAIKILPDAELYKFTGMKERPYRNGSRIMEGECKANGTPWIAIPNYSPNGLYSHEEIKACHSKAGLGYDVCYHFKEINGLKFNDIYKQIQNMQSANRKIFEQNYDREIFDGMMLVDAIETFNKEAIKQKSAVQSILETF